MQPDKPVPAKFLASGCYSTIYALDGVLPLWTRWQDIPPSEPNHFPRVEQDLLFGVNPSCRTGDALIGVRKVLHGDLHFVNGLKGPVSLPKYVFLAQILPHQILPKNAPSVPRLLSQRYSGLDQFVEGPAPSKSTGLSAGAIVGIVIGSLAAALALAYGLLLVGRHANAQQVSDKRTRKALGCTLGQRRIPILKEGFLPLTSSQLFHKVWFRPRGYGEQGAERPANTSSKGRATLQVLSVSAGGH